MGIGLRRRASLRALAFAFAVTFVLAAALSLLPGATGRAVAEAPSAFPPFDAIVLATPHDAEGAARSSEVRQLHAGGAQGRSASTATTTLLGVVPHAPGAVVRGDVHDGVVWIVADAPAARADAADWGAALFEVRAANAGVVRVLERVVHAGRPLASASGVVFVERGYAGTPPSPSEVRQGLLRVDAITIDAFDPRSSSTRTLYASDAYALHIAGEHARELVVYRVAPEGASLLAIDEVTGASRVVCALMPFARDFSIDDAHGALILSNRDAADAHVWTVESIDLATGSSTRLHAVRGDQPAALVLPRGSGSGSGGSNGIARTADARRGLVVSGRTMAPLGGGFDAPTLVTADGALLAIEHRESGAFDRTAIVDVATGRALRFDADAPVSGGDRITVLALGHDAQSLASGGVR